MPPSSGSSSTGKSAPTITDGAVHHVPHKKRKSKKAGSEAATAHEAAPTSTTTNSTPTAEPFDVKSILPASKPLKSFSKLQEASSSANKHARSQTYSYIDGEVRGSHDDVSPGTPIPGHRPFLQSEERIPPRLRSSSDAPKREQFTAFGIEAFPTAAVFNEICYDFVSMKRWCQWGRDCHRIHPLRKQLYLEAALQESDQFSRMRAAALAEKTFDIPVQPRREKSPQRKESDASPHTSQSQLSHPADESIRVKLPQTSFNPIHGPSSGRPSKTSPAYARRSTRQLPRSRSSSTDTGTRRAMDEGRLKTPWGDRAPSDTSSSSGDSDVASSPLFPAHARYWEASTETSAWYSDDEESSKEVARGPGPASQVVSDGANISPAVSSTRHDRQPDEQGSQGRQLNDEAPRERHPRPRNKERCINWLRNRCTRGYDCHYVHDDLKYDDDEPPKQPDFSTILHSHMQLRFGPGFEVTEFRTGFESRWLHISRLPRNITDGKLRYMLRPYGEVLEIRRPLHPLPHDSFLRVKVFFSRASEAYNAFTSLHNSRQFGQTLECRMSVDSKAGGITVNNTAVRIDWEGPSRTVYMGYANEELANEAIQKARVNSYGDYMTYGVLHIGMPAVGNVTVKFTGLPVDVTEEGMEIFGAHQGMVTEDPSHKYVTLEDTINGVKRLLRHPECRPTEVHFRPPPYRNCRLRAWAIYTSPNEAERAAERLNGRKSEFSGSIRVTAKHIKTVAFSLSVQKYLKAAVQIRALSDQLYSQGDGYSLNVSDKQDFFNLRLCGEDMKVLVRLKSEVERLFNGEPLLEDGKVAWDDFFGRPLGISFLQDLQRDHPGVLIDNYVARRSIRLFGATEKRRLVREKILEKLSELRARNWYTIPLYGLLTNVLLKGDFATLQQELGADNVKLDPWQRLLKVRGDIEAFNTAKDIVEAAKIKHRASQFNPPLPYSPEECPVCLEKVTSGIKLDCGHSWCRNCLKRYLEAAIEQKYFPLKCLGNSAKCTERIPLLTARALLPAASLDALVHAAFGAHVQSHSDLHYCPTPDCPQVYRSAKGGVFIQCPSCLIRICPSCHTDAHDGLTCAESKHGDDLFDEWAGQHDVKRCPGCNVAIEKEEGCNHMTCTMCNTHICWVCLQTFPNGEGIYGHMRSEHGDFGLGPII
ncbi:hypothetical protein CVT26_002307 [Gymnopilus dilepis]|uniref:Uncharacterized protein n=1 Tax=Gymnopilus dilepis TaxID=231916 RepID=A0A409Y3L0_9AGAR|nr:hypothetical protein CVT26_002307 [Gymnopilus dilepis]